MKLIIGLGNPDKQYEKTRHNIGFLVLEALRKELELPAFKVEPKYKSSIAACSYKSKKIILAQPQTFMNNSGVAVALLKNYYKIKPEDIIIIRDDIDLPFGKFRQKQTSGSGGHQGINSIIDYLKSKNFIQIKIGIKNPALAKMDPADFVLSRFTAEEQRALKQLIPHLV